MNEEFAFRFVGEEDVVSGLEPEIQSPIPLLGWLSQLAARIEVRIPIIS